MLICSIHFNVIKSTKTILQMNIRLEPKEITDAYSLSLINI